MLERVEAQRHRRFFKSHLAADGVRFFPQAKYIVVGRDTRDVFMSMFNHYSGYTDFMYKLFNDADRPGPEFPHCPATPREMWPRWIGEGWFDWEPDGWPFWSHHHHLATWWEIRDLPNVLFVHYGDLKADPETEMRRIAAFCGFEVDEDAWPALLATVDLDAMRAEARGADDPLTMAWTGGAASSSTWAPTAAGVTCSPRTTSRCTRTQPAPSTRIFATGWNTTGERREVAT